MQYEYSMIPYHIIRVVAQQSRSPKDERIVLGLFVAVISSETHHQVFNILLQGLVVNAKPAEGQLRWVAFVPDATETLNLLYALAQLLCLPR